VRTIRRRELAAADGDGDGDDQKELRGGSPERNLIEVTRSSADGTC
jgi:hypothetical protein